MAEATADLVPAVGTRLAALPLGRGVDSSGTGGDARPLTAREMGRLAGRGPLPYFNGTLPWQRSFHDVNLCNGNLFKSFTDVQVAPARGAGLVLSRTYNSNDARVQEAADVQAQSGNMAVDGQADDVPRTDFFGHKHVYHRDADGLYSPPPYLFDETQSDYAAYLVNGPTKVMDDTETGMDGTVKHYQSVVTLADGTPGNERACDSITDRHGNRTTLAYGQTIQQPDGSVRTLLTSVTDPTGRSLQFTWANLNPADPQNPAWRVTQAVGPLVDGLAVSGVTYVVDYAYYSPGDPAAGGADYQLKSVTLDPGGLSRTTTYTYTSGSGTYYDQNNTPQTATEYGLLSSVTDPLGHTVSYAYAAPSGGFTNTAWVTQVTEPGGVDAGGSPCALVWTIAPDGSSASGVEDDGNPPGSQPESYIGDVTVACNDPTLGGDPALGGEPDDQYVRFFRVDPQLRAAGMRSGLGIGSGNEWELFYDASNDLVGQESIYIEAPSLYSTYGPHGNVLTQGQGGEQSNGYTPYADATTTYDNASQYFAKASDTDADGHTTAYGIGTDNDANIGDRGETLWVRDPGYNDGASPSYHKQYVYTYNQYGQKLTETNLNGVVTQYTYGADDDAADGWYDQGNLVQVVQDPGGAGHLSRTTTMHYDAAGRVLQSTDPAGRTSTFTYNALGQPLTVQTPASGSAPAETISYAYDTNGRTESVTDGRGTTTMAYEAGCDRVSSVTDPVTGTTAYTYLLTGDRASVSLPGGGTWTYGYADPGGSETLLTPEADPEKFRRNLLSVTDDQGRQVLFSMDEQGPTSVFSDQVFDGQGRLVSCLETDYTYSLDNPNYGVGDETHDRLMRVRATWSGPGPANGYGERATISKVVSEDDYTYDNAGQRLTNAASSQVLDNTGTPETDGSGNPVMTTRTETYTYDDLSRLSTVDYGDGQTQGYGFDAMGNRLQRQDSAAGTTNYAYDAANRLTGTTGAGASTYANDADGNTLSGGGRVDTWDSQNRLVSCAFNGNTSTYTYGADGLRRRGTVNGAVTNYAYDGESMVRELKANLQGTLVPSATYLSGARGPEYRRDDTQAEPDGQGHTFGRTRWYVYDGLGSVVGEVDPLGNLTSSPKYDVYGGVRGNGGAASSKQGFVGGLAHLSEAETGLVYMRARYYDPQLGRFESEDLRADGVNWFAYCGNNPVNNVDPDGKTNQNITEARDWYACGMAMALFSSALSVMGAGLCKAGYSTVAIAIALSAFYCFGRCLDDAQFNSGIKLDIGAMGTFGGWAAGGFLKEVILPIIADEVKNASALAKIACPIGMQAAGAVLGVGLAETAALAACG